MKIFSNLWVIGIGTGIIAGLILYAIFGIGKPRGKNKSLRTYARNKSRYMARLGILLQKTNNAIAGDNPVLSIVKEWEKEYRDVLLDIYKAYRRKDINLSSDHELLQLYGSNSRFGKPDLFGDRTMSNEALELFKNDIERLHRILENS